LSSGQTSRGTVARRATILAGVALVFGLVLGVQRPEPTLFWDAWFDAGHVPLFGALALLLRGTSRHQVEPRASLRAFGLAVIIGIGVEFAQAWQPGREPSIADVLHDAAGAAAFLGLRLAWMRSRGAAPSRARRSSRALLAGGILLLAVAFAPLTACMTAYAARTRALPVLFPLDGRWWESWFVRVDAARLIPGARAAPGRDRASTRLDLLPGRYPGITLEEPAGDWTRFRRLVLEFASDLDAPFPLNVRIHDRDHVNRYDDRYNARIMVPPGHSRVNIELDAVRDAPATRPMDLRAIRAIVLFAADLRQPTHIFIGPVRLE
jgi:VanZ family protein